MKNALILSFLLLATASDVFAQKMSFKEVVDSTITVNVVSCSSSTPTLMDSTSAVAGMQLRSFVAFQNLDTTSYICLGFNANMTCASGSILSPENYGLVSIPLALWKQGGQQSETINTWCKTSSTSGPSNLALIQGF